MRGKMIESSAANAGPARWGRRGATLLALGAVAACGAGNSNLQEGNLGHGGFLYECDSDQDPICPPSTATSTTAPHTMDPACAERYNNTADVQCFPTSVAVGGRFRIQFYPDPGLANLGNPVLKVVSTSFMSATGDGHFKGVKPGYAAVYAQSTVDSTLVDYTLVKIAPIAKLQIDDLATKKQVPPQVTVPMGTPASFALVAIDRDDQKMAGAIESFSWEVQNTKGTSFQLLDAANSASMHVGTVKTALSGDTATLTAYADDSKTVKATVDLVVQ